MEKILWPDRALTHAVLVDVALAIHEVEKILWPDRALTLSMIFSSFMAAVLSGKDAEAR